MPFEATLIITIVFSFILALVYRLLTKPAEVKQIKDEVKILQKRSRELQKEGRQEESTKVLNESMQTNMKMMKMMMRPMLLSLILFFFFATWTAAAYAPTIIVPTEDVSIAGFENARTGTFEFEDVSYDFVIHDGSERVRFDLNGNGNFADETDFGLDEIIFTRNGQYWKFFGEEPDQFPFYTAPEGNVQFTPDIVLAPFEIPLLAWDFVGVPFVATTTSLHFYWWYIIIIVPFTFFFRKLLGVE